MTTLNRLSVSALVLAVAGAASANLVVNGGFETGDFTGWNLSGNTGFTGVVGTFGYAPASGNFQAAFGAVGSTGTLTQSTSFATTAGQTYKFTFDLANLGGPTNSFDASFNGTSLYSLSDANPFGYSTLTFYAVATGSTSNIAFTIRQDPSYFLLDNVSVVAAPAPAALASFGLGLIGRARRRKKA